MSYQVATIAATNPNKRVIAVANPSGHGYRSGLLTHAQRKAMTHGDFRPVVDPFLQYLDKERIEEVQHVGYSYAADKAAVAAASSAQETGHLIAIEPASVVKRSVGELALAFASTNKALEGYARASNLPTFEAARNDSVGLVSYTAGLARLSNIAVARALTDGKFETRMDAALSMQPEMKTTIAWGSESELAIDGVVATLTDNLHERHGAARVRAIRLSGQKHALLNDVHLQAALVLEGLRA